MFAMMRKVTTLGEFTRSIVRTGSGRRFCAANQNETPGGVGLRNVGSGAKMIAYKEIMQMEAKWQRKECVSD